MKIRSNPIYSYKSDGEVVLRGKTVPYQIITEEMILETEGGTASMMTYSYLRKDVEAAYRPVLFGFNGGPGASSIFLHFGFLGPKRVRIEDVQNTSETGTVSLQDNVYSILDICDIVFIDPAGTGYTPVPDTTEAKKEFYSVRGDAKAFALVIENWIGRNGRWNSPKYLIGESYGTLRSSILPGILYGGPGSGMELTGINIDGVVLMGAALQTEPGFPGSEPFPSEMWDILTMAAVNHYHTSDGKPDLGLFLEECEEFLHQTYLQALYQGNQLAEEKKEAAADRLEYFTGIPKTYFMSSNLHITFAEFKRMRIPGMELGVYDGRCVLKGNIANGDPVCDDAAMGTYCAAFCSCMGQKSKELFGIEAGRKFTAINFGVGVEWNFSTIDEMSWNGMQELTYLKELEKAMRRNENMRVFFVSGIYDLLTVYGKIPYLLAHSELPFARVKVGDYPSGHMMYLGEESCRMLAEDLRAFIKEGERQ